MDTKILQKLAKNYSCIFCAFNTSNKTNYNNHLLTAKHIRIQDGIKNLQKLQKNCKKDNKNNDVKYKCKNCNKGYVYQSGLYRHIKKCIILNTNISNNNITPDNSMDNSIDNIMATTIDNNFDYKQMFLVLVEQLKDQSSLIKEIIPKIGNNIINNTNNNNNVNIQVFLNDTCKDAMSLTDFINTIQVSITDLLFTKENGLTKGITNLFLSNLERIPMIQRPLWCSDKKRKRMFIKQDKWIEDMEREKTNELVNTISKIQTKNINKYIADKPNWMTNDKIKDNYMHLIKSVTDSMDNKIEKILDNIVDKIHLTEEAREKMLK